MCDNDSDDDQYCRYLVPPLLPVAAAAKTATAHHHHGEVQGTYKLKDPVLSKERNTAEQPRTAQSS